MMLRLMVAAFMFAWFCQYNGQDYGPFESYDSCQNYNGAYFNYRGVCHRA